MRFLLSSLRSLKEDGEIIGGGRITKQVTKGQNKVLEEWGGGWISCLKARKA